jgi:hypothetical protein
VILNYRQKKAIVNALYLAGRHYLAIKLQFESQRESEGLDIVNAELNMASELQELLQAVETMEVR